MPQASHSSIFPVRDWRLYVRSAIAVTEIAVSTIPVNANATYPGITTDSVGIQYGKRKKSKRVVADHTANPMTDCSECFGPKGLRPVTIITPPAKNMMVDKTVTDAAVS